MDGVSPSCLFLSSSAERTFILPLRMGLSTLFPPVLSPDKDDLFSLHSRRLQNFSFLERVKGTITFSPPYPFFFDVLFVLRRPPPFYKPFPLATPVERGRQMLVFPLGSSRTSFPVAIFLLSLLAMPSFYIKGSASFRLVLRHSSPGELPSLANSTITRPFPTKQRATFL